PQRLALELIPRAAGPPGKRVVAVLAHLHAGLPRLAQLLADVVQEGRRDAERHRTRRGRDRLVDRKMRLLHTLDDPAVLLVGLLQELLLLGGPLQRAATEQAG